MVPLNGNYTFHSIFSLSLLHSTLHEYFRFTLLSARQETEAGRPPPSWVRWTPQTYVSSLSTMVSSFFHFMDADIESLHADVVVVATASLVVIAIASSVVGVAGCLATRVLAIAEEPWHHH